MIDKNGEWLNANPRRLLLEATTTYDFNCARTSAQFNNQWRLIQTIRSSMHSCSGFCS